MKICGQKMEITLRVGGQERTFSEQELISILENHFLREETKRRQRAAASKIKAYEVADIPTEGKIFKVEPKTIDLKLFQEKREDSKQEQTRQLILEALEEMETNPERYAEPFETFVPEKPVLSTTIEELEELSEKLGGYTGNWVEQALEWAQRISNGESWEKLCNAPGTARWYTLVKWKNDEHKLVGGSIMCGDNKPASNVGNYILNHYGRLTGSIPFVVF